MADRTPWPVEIRLNRAERVLEVDYDDGVQLALPAELLRVESPSAEVQQHGGDKMIVPGKRDVAVTSVESVGNYAVRLIFDDGHDTPDASGSQIIACRAKPRIPFLTSVCGRHFLMPHRAAARRKRSMMARAYSGRPSFLTSGSTRSSRSSSPVTLLSSALPP